RDYDMPVQSALWPLLEQYLRRYRPLLAAPGNDRVFVSRRQPRGEWKGLNRRYERLTKRYVHGCPGGGPHSIRHIVATTILKQTGSVIAAAVVLHDREETVREHYARFISEDGAQYLAKAAGEVFRAMW